MLIAAFLALRLTALLTGIEAVSWDEELYRGTIAQEWIDGLKLPLWEYQADPYDGGSLAVGALTVPLFLLLGPNLLALKLVPLGFSLGGLILTLLFLKRFFGQKAAVIGGALFVLSPPVFAGLSLCAIGSYTESILFSAAEFFFFFQYLYGTSPYRIRWLILWGLAGGLGIWFTPTSAPILLAQVAAWALEDRRGFFGWRSGIFLGSFMLGAFPWFLYNATHQFQGLRYLAEVFLTTGGLSPEGKLMSIPLKGTVLVTQTLPFCFRFRPLFGIPGEFFSVAYAALAAVGIAPLLRSRDRRIIPLLLYPIFFILGFSLSTYDPAIPSLPTLSDFRYFSTFYYVVFLLLAVALSKRRAPVLTGGALLGLGLLGQASLLFQEPVGRALAYRGYSFVSLGELWGTSRYPFPQGLESFQRIAGRFRESERRTLYWGLSNTIPWNRYGSMENLSAPIRQIPASYQSYFWENWGRALRGRLPSQIDRIDALSKRLSEEGRRYLLRGLATKSSMAAPDRTLEETLRLIRRLGPADPAPFYADLGRSLYGTLESKGQPDGILARLSIPEIQDRRAVYRGMGEEAALHWITSITFRPRNPTPVWKKLPSEAQDEFAWGIGFGLRAQMELPEDRTRAIDWLHRLPEAIRSPAWNGFQAYESWYGISPKG